jgi:hypothetical protein
VRSTSVVPYLRPRGLGRANFPTTCEGSNQHSSTTYQNVLQAVCDPCKCRLPRRCEQPTSFAEQSAGVLGAQMRRLTTHFPTLLRWVLASSLKPMGRGLVHLAMLSTASGWQIPSQESQAKIVGKVERARDRRRLADNCNGSWSVTRSHAQSLAQPNP